MLPNSQKKADKKIRCGNFIALSCNEASRIAFRVDKTIATHTKGYVKSQYWLYIPMMWCYCYHLHSKWNFARISLQKIISITPFVKKSSHTATAVLNCCKYSKKMDTPIWSEPQKLDKKLLGFILCVRNTIVQHC